MFKECDVSESYCAGYLNKNLRVNAINKYQVLKQLNNTLIEKI